MKTNRIQLGLLVGLVGVLAVVYGQQQAIRDWFKLRGYSPPAAISQLGTQDTMTPQALHLWYVNKPEISSGTAFTAHCPVGGEKTVVLGCYVGVDQGIFIYDVRDTRLNGVEQVTAAHEMLHAAYQRLSKAERSKIDAQLADYYEHGLTDQRIKDIIAAYKISEPQDVVNEMHSVFGTEIAQLPSGLETYYRQYFTNRSVVTTLTATYQAEFTSRTDQVTAYDSQLKGLKTQIDSYTEQLKNRRQSLDAQSQRMESERVSGQVASYNSDVASYNSNVASYNALLAQTKSLINQYNTIVNSRNTVALEEQQLAQELSASSVDK